MTEPYEVNTELLLPENRESQLTERQRGFYVAVQTLGAAGVALFYGKDNDKMRLIHQLAQAMLDEMFTIEELKDKSNVR